MKSGSRDMPWILEKLTRPWHRRHPRLTIMAWILGAYWVVFLGIMLCSIGDWAGALLFAAAGFLLWCAYAFDHSLPQD